MTFSIIIPTLNEAETILQCLLALQPLRAHCEIIIADGGSTDSTCTKALSLVDKIISSPRGRAKQMNNGAQQATGDVFLFLHADTYLPDNALRILEQHLLDSHKTWGRFDIQLNSDKILLKMVAIMMNWRSRLTGIATGDQVIFVEHTTFVNSGGYREIDLMEDISLCSDLKKISHPLCLTAKVISSARRWQHYGITKTILLMWWLRLRYFLGANPSELAQLYRTGKPWKI